MLEQRASKSPSPPASFHVRRVSFDSINFPDMDMGKKWYLKSEKMLLPSGVEPVSYYRNTWVISGSDMSVAETLVDDAESRMDGVEVDTQEVDAESEEDVGFHSEDVRSE